MKKQVLDIFRNSLLIAAVASVSATHSVAQTSSDYNKRELLWQVLDQSRANDYVPVFFNIHFKDKTGQKAERLEEHQVFCSRDMGGATECDSPTQTRART